MPITTQKRVAPGPIEANDHRSRRAMTVGAECIAPSSRARAILDAWAAGVENGRTHDFRHRDVIYEEHADIGHVYLVASGYVKLSRLTLDGDLVIHAVLGPGNLFGRTVLPGLKPARETATAAGQARVLGCIWTEFEHALDRSGTLAALAISNLGARVQELQRRYEYVLHHDLRCRVAATLHDLIGGNGGACRHGHALDVRLTQQELADLVGASRPAVSAMLNELRREGVISYTRAFICVDDLKHLGNIAHSPMQPAERNR